MGEEYSQVKKVLVAMSGGVDSSTTAYILKEEGFEVVGATLRLWRSNDDKNRPGGCCSIDDIQDARRVCNFLGIKHYVMNYEEEFKNVVVDGFVNSYLCGKTPNPCIVCNDKIKFSKLLDKTKGLGFDFLATGHYGIIEKSAHGFLLKKGLDPAKDQSYVLFGIRRAILPHLFFPIGGYRKEQIRDVARRANLGVAEKPDSVEICFVPDNDHFNFIRRRRPEGTLIRRERSWPSTKGSRSSPSANARGSASVPPAAATCWRSFPKPATWWWATARNCFLQACGRRRSTGS